MKILTLEIENIRGIRSHILLEPSGENVVIYGPNGTGKSGVVDAIDFLFTGDISRLSGIGTKDMSIKRHGAHVDAVPTDAVVKAKVQIDGVEDPIEIERKMSAPKNLICLSNPSAIIDEVFSIAEKGHQVLSRGEILKYIAAESGKRADEIQKILDLSVIENIRKLLVNIDRDFDKNTQNSKLNLDKTISIINTKLALDEFSEEEVLNKVNQLRKTLKGDRLAKLDPDKLHDNITPMSQPESKQVNTEYLNRVLDYIDSILTEKGEATYAAEMELRQTIKKLNENEKLRRELKSKRMLELGILLLDDSGACPLCLTPWKPGKLEPFLRERISKADEAEEAERSIRAKAAQINKDVSTLEGQLTELIKLSSKLDLKHITNTLEEWQKTLGGWSGRLKNAVDTYPEVEPDEQTKTLYRPSKWVEQKKELTKAAAHGKLTPEQEAWDILTELKSNLERYFDEKNKCNESERLAKKAAETLSTYIETKDRVLETLYDSVKDEFITYYKELHRDDEDTFSADLKSDGAKLDLTVDFYGRGSHHPRALHSEGHQDSMGLCLYLALNKKISEGKVKLVILDDVVMSIDSGHRRNVCKLLTEHFPDNQFIITTHNRTWARQLQADGVVKSKNMIEFKGWSVDSGPKLSSDSDVWGEIYTKLENNNIASAAHQLREHAEFFYEQVCDSLWAEVRYRSDARWELGAYLNGAKKAYKEYMKKAKNAANSWGLSVLVDELSQLETNYKEVVDRTQSEQWALNENVHYSKWSDFEKDDFLPIVEAFHDLEGVFICQACRGIISLSMKGMTPTNIKCSCGKLNWNLESKKS